MNTTTLKYRYYGSDEYHTRRFTHLCCLGGDLIIQDRTGDEPPSILEVIRFWSVELNETEECHAAIKTAKTNPGG